MEITSTPLHITAFQHFNTDGAVVACKRFLPERVLDSHPDLLSALSAALGVDADDLWIQVRDAVLGSDCEIQVAIKQWLMSYGLSQKQYLHFVVNHHHPIHSLFLWIVVHLHHQHINIMHVSGVWTSQRSDITVLMDATIILVLNCCLSTCKISREAIKSADDTYMQCFCDP